MRSHGYRDVRTEKAGLLALPYYALDEIKILHQKVVRELAQELQTVTQLGLKHDGQIAVGAQAVEVQKSNAPQFFPGVGNLGQGGARPLGEAMEGGINSRHQQFIFILEIKIDGAVSHAGTVGNFRHARVKKAVLGYDFDGGIQDALVFVGGSA